ncbi:integrator complex subunit 12 [Diachasmimorpha longicaudata]|uniref:integrator complex subunit 12 n=1 Tax=Diachasmimorpha longicaudata TaxID=58733 RepID=UPI0030B8B0F9
MTHSDLDSHFVQGLRLLHSSNKDSMDQLRSLLDEAIKQKHGLSKMLCNVLHKKYTMEEPVLSDHSSTSSKRSKSSSASSKHSHKSNKSDSPEEVIPRTPPELLISDDPLAEILEDDLTCVVCKGMDVGARNRLVECADCHALYHQECHTPHIQDSQIDVPKLLWYCSNCIKAHQPPKDKPPPKPPVESKKDVKKSTSSSKHSDKYKSSSSHSVITDSSVSKTTPSINIITGDRRLKDVTKKAKGDKRSSSTSSSKYTSSSSSSKNSEKSSRKND